MKSPGRGADKLGQTRRIPSSPVADECVRMMSMGMS